MLPGMPDWTWEQGVVIATLVGSLLLFVTDRMRYDAVAVLVVLTLAASGCLSPDEAFEGFSSKAVVLVGSMYVFSAAIERAGISGLLAKSLLRGRRPSEAGLALRVTITAGVLSSILSNAAVVAALIPVIGTVAKKSGVPASRLLIPLSFGSLLGGLLTLIGTSKNIALNETIEAAGAAPFGLFDFSAFGLVLLGLGALYFVGPGRALLPKRRTDTSLADHYQVPKFVTEILVEPSSDLVDHTVEETRIHERFGVNVLGMVRAEAEDPILAPGAHDRILPDDVLILQGEPEAILRMRQELDLEERKEVQAGPTRLVAGDVQLVEAVVPATSPYVHATLRSADFHAQTNINCLAISKHGDVLPTKIDRIRLDVGDTLLLQGHVRDIWRQHQRRELIILAEHQDPRVGKKAVYTLLLLAAFLTLAATKAVPLSVAALGGAVGLVLFRCVRPDDVLRTMNWSVLLLIGGMLALGKAFHVHALDHRVAESLQAMSSGMANPFVAVGVFLFATVLLTQVVNHVAAAVLMAPIALEFAAQLGLNDRALLMAVLTGAEFAFMSPIAHQANTMVMGPGGYRFVDFLRAGAPLTVLLGTAATALIPFFWPS